MIEVEIKLKVAEHDRIKDCLSLLGFHPAAKLWERDQYFDTLDGRIRAGDCALRIRETEVLSTGERIIQLNYKGKKMDTQTMTREEQEMTISDAATGRKILEALGYRCVEPVVEKVREEYICGDMTACLDQVQGLGSFLELEIITDDAGSDAGVMREAALRQIEAVLDRLGVQIRDTLTISYLSMLEKKEIRTEEK